MSKVLIMIHGRSNKPAKHTLTEWWMRSIEEGLLANEGISLKDIPYEMVYYADLHYTDGPLSQEENREPYRKSLPGSLKRYRKGVLDRLREVNILGTPADWLEEHVGILSKAAREIAEEFLRDLGWYYKNKDFKYRVDKRLRDILLRHRGEEIILLSHSMGTIVAYEVLREIGRIEEYSDFTIEHFITMGSPLGLTPVKGNIFRHMKNVRTPSCVSVSWTNFSDPQDIVCLDTHLRDDYMKNSRGVRVRDLLICNDYPGNQHKSYGYLRTPEFSELLAGLL